MRQVIGVFAVFACVTVTGAQERVLELSVRPQTCVNPCTIQLNIRAEPAAENRALMVELDSPVYSRASMIPLDGTDSPAMHVRRFDALPMARYTLRVALVRADDDRVWRSETIQVLGQRD